MPATLNDIERKILDFMVQYLRENTYQPSIREIGERFGIKSTKTVSEHLSALAEKGFLERDPSRSRGVRILGVDLHPDTVSLPCYGEIPDTRAVTSRAESFLTVDRRMAGSEGCFFVRARGDEATLLGVQKGDYLLVEPALPDQLRDGAVVVVRREGRPSFHRFSHNGAGLVLEPLRPAQGSGGSLRIDDWSSVEMVGRVVALYRRLDEGAEPVSLTAH